MTDQIILALVAIVSSVIGLTLSIMRIELEHIGLTFSALVLITISRTLMIASLLISGLVIVYVILT